MDGYNGNPPLRESTCPRYDLFLRTAFTSPSYHDGWASKYVFVVRRRRPVPSRRMA